MYLRALRWVEIDTCHAVLGVDGSADVEILFRVKRRHGAVVVQPDEMFLDQFVGSAAEIRQVANAVVQFCLAAQGETAGADRP